MRSLISEELIYRIGQLIRNLRCPGDSRRIFAEAGALGDIGTHVVDMLRFLVGDFKKVNARTATYIPERPVQSGLTDSLGNARLNKDTPRKAVDVDDQCMFMIECENGAFGSIEATKKCMGKK